MIMFEQTPINMLGNSLDATSKRHEVISDNIANANTPGFKKGRVEFESMLKEAMETEQTEGSGKATRENHMPIGVESNGVEPQVVREGTTSMRSDENNVDIDTEMSRLTENSLHHQALTRQLGNEFNKLHTAVQGGN